MTLELAIGALWVIGNGLIITYAVQQRMKLAAAALYLTLTAAVVTLPSGPLMWLPVAIFTAVALRAGYLLRKRQDQEQWVR